MTNNNELSSIIEDKKLTISLLMESDDIEDFELDRLKQYMQLPELYQDLIYMEKVLHLTRRQIATVYKVSKSMVNKMANKIKMEFYL